MAVSPWSLFQALGWEFLALGMLFPSTPFHGPLALGNWNPLRRSLSFGAKVDSPPHIKTHKCRRYTLQTPRNRELKAENNHGIFGKERPSTVSPPTEIFLDWPLGPEVPEEEEGKLASSLGISGGPRAGGGARGDRRMQKFLGRRRGARRFRWNGWRLQIWHLPPPSPHHVRSHLNGRGGGRSKLSTRRK